MFDVFISSRSKDYHLSRMLYDFLNKLSYNVFFCEVSLPKMGEAEYRKEIDKALEASQHLIVVTSSYENVTHGWVEAEWGAFVNEKRSGKKTGNIVTLVAGEMTIEELPLALRQYEVFEWEKALVPRLLDYLKPLEDRDFTSDIEVITEAAGIALGLPEKVEEYLEWMKEESENLNILKRLSKEIKLEDIYISVRTTKFEKRDYQDERKREMERIKGNREEEKALVYKDPRMLGEKKFEAKVFQWKNERKKYRKCALLGDPGAGKSTLLRWESCQVIKEGLEKIDGEVSTLISRFPCSFGLLKFPLK